MGSKGIRSYQKSSHIPFHRVELQLNKSFLRHHSIKYSSLPISIDDFDIFKYIQFYNCLSKRVINNIAERIVKKTRPGLKDEPRKLGRRVYKRVIGRMIYDGLGEVTTDDLTRYRSLVSGQMDHIKSICSKYNLRYKKEKLFEKSSIFKD